MGFNTVNRSMNSSHTTLNPSHEGLNNSASKGSPTLLNPIKHSSKPQSPSSQRRPLVHARTARERAAAIPRLFVASTTASENSDIVSSAASNTDQNGASCSKGDTTDVELLVEVLSTLSSTAPFPVHSALHTARSPPAAPKEEYQPPEVLQQGLTIMSTIGEGAFSKVKLAQHTLIDKPVALKIIDKRELAKKGVAVNQLLREILLLASLNHPNINRLLQIIDSPTHIYVVLEYESGGELFDVLLLRKKMPENEARGYMRQIVCGLQYCHLQGIIHRDLKLENILINKHGVVKICDFGFSNLLREGAQTFETFCGSPPYAAPEMVSRKKYQGPEVDVWSLGVILYTMVTGVMPFGQKSLPKLFVSIMSGKYETPAKASQELQSLIASILTVKPADRATLDQIRAHPWMAHTDIDMPLVLDSISVEPTLRDDVLAKVESAGYDQAAIESFVETHELGVVKTAYYLYLADAGPAPQSEPEPESEPELPSEPESKPLSEPQSELPSKLKPESESVDTKESYSRGQPSAEPIAAMETKTNATLVRAIPPLGINIDAALMGSTISKRKEGSAHIYSPTSSTSAASFGASTLVHIRQLHDSSGFTPRSFLAGKPAERDQSPRQMCWSFQATMSKADVLDILVCNLAGENIQVPSVSKEDESGVVFDTMVWQPQEQEEIESPSFLEAVTPEDAMELLLVGYESPKVAIMDKVEFKTSLLTTTASSSLAGTGDSPVTTIVFEIKRIDDHCYESFEKVVTKLMSRIH
ncbi:hypothetical protein BASA83_001881 [Batrachochytrium salamandrivorans]|nr:hypothetical protein BASA83_001881 [Batrachochytrium salamandrivorans]